MENKRLESLDAFRGFDMMWIMGFASILVAVCRLFPGGESCFLIDQMEHVEWDGLAFMDLVFPTFLFIAGISFPFSSAKQQSLGVSRGKMYWKIARRALILVLFGIISNGFLGHLDFAGARYCSVLGRIGLAWALAAVLYMNFGRTARIIVAAVVLLAYFLVLKFIPAPDGAGAPTLSPEGNIAYWIDRQLLPGSFYKGTWDPEGLLGLFPATVTAMLGMFTGEFVRSDRFSGSKKTLLMFVSAVALIALGLVWSIWMPVNKSLWSSSFVLVAGGIALAGFALFYWIIDVRGVRGPLTFFFKVIGMNSITIYMAMHFIPFGAIAHNFLDGLCGFCPSPIAALLIFVGDFALKWLFLLFLYRKRVFLKV